MLIKQHKSYLPPEFQILRMQVLFQKLEGAINRHLSASWSLQNKFFFLGRLRNFKFFA